MNAIEVSIQPLEERMMKALFAALSLLVALSGPVRAETTIVFATDATWPPMEMVNDQKQVVGYSIEYMTAAGKEVGFTPVFKNTAWDGIFAGLDNKKYDAIVSSVSITEDRKKAMDFSEPYYTVRQALIVPKASTAQSLADLKGQKVGGQIGTTGYFAIKAAEGVEPKSYDEVGLAMEDLNVGRIAAVVCDWLKSPDILATSEVDDLTSLQGLASEINAGCASAPLYEAHMLDTDVGNQQRLGFLISKRLVDAAYVVFSLLVYGVMLWRLQQAA